MATEVRSPKPARPACLDAFRGLDILVMIFVNYVAGMHLSPAWLQHVGNGVDGYTITDIVFPGFLFIVGVAIPLALHKRMVSGESLWKLAKHILSRTFALLFLGVLLVNQNSLDAGATACPGPYGTFSPSSRSSSFGTSIRRPRTPRNGGYS